MSRALAATLLASSLAWAGEPRVIKMAAISPEGTLWSREIKAMADEVGAATDGAVRIKLYFGAVAGDEREVADRIRRGQLDGATSGGVMCQQVSPTLRAISIPGLFETREEGETVTQKLRTVAVDEAQASGFQLLGVAPLGQDLLFTRAPVRSFDELKRVPLWRWDGDEAGIAAARAMGLRIVPTAVPEAATALEDGRIDGVMAIPMAALAFQWSTRTRYLVPLRLGHLNGCFLVANRAFDKLPIEHQQAVRSAVAKLAARVDDVSRRENEALVEKLFARQGLKVVAPSAAFRADWFAAAARARATLAEPVVARAAVDRVVKARDEARALARSR